MDEFEKLNELLEQKIYDNTGISKDTLYSNNIRIIEEMILINNLNWTHPERSIFGYLIEYPDSDISFKMMQSDKNNSEYDDA